MVAVSPIRSTERSRYPVGWPKISLGVREDSGWRCECRGECGSPRHRRPGRCEARQGDALAGGSRVVLTVAHLDHTPENCARSNLRAMCQACHLHYDRDHHRTNAAATRRRRVEDAGQIALEVTA